MRKKLLIAALALFVGSATAHAALVPVYTSCGKIVFLESKQYKTAEDMAKDAAAIDEAICGRKDNDNEKNEKIIDKKREFETSSPDLG